MMGICLILAALGVGPELNPIDGTRVVASDRELFVSGRDVSSVADIWLVQVVNQQVGAGGITRFDPIRLAFHGNSWTQTRFLLNGLEMTDPGRSGSPLVELPFGAWDALEFRYQTQAKPGFNFIYKPDRDVPVLSGEVRFGRPVGGGTWVPVGLMDREPATYHGATETRRALDDAREVDGHYQFRSERWAGRVGAEFIGHTHSYPGFVDENSTALRDEADRVAVVGGATLKGGPVPVDVVFAAAEHRRSHEGAEFRLPLDYTRNVLSRSFVLQGRAEVGRLEIKAGGGWAKDTERPNVGVPLVKDLTEEWMWLERPRLAEDLSRWRWDLDLLWTPEPKSGGQIEWDLGMRAGVVGLLATPRWGSDLVAVTYNGASSVDDRSVWVTHYDTTSAQDLRWGDLRPELRMSGAFGAVRWRGNLGWTLTSLNHSRGEVFNRNGFIAGLSGRRKMGEFQLFAAARREPEEMTSEVARFIDSDSPSGSRHDWDDKDGDGLPGPTEQGEVIGRTGGAYHEVDPALTTPTRSFVTAGVKTPRFGPFVFLLMTHFRWLQNRYTVRYGPEGEPDFVAREILDLGGDRKELTVYDRLPGTEGEEWYQLTNATRSDFYFGTELQLKTEGVSGWFLNLSASGYLSQGSGVFGTFPDRNDAGILDEISADPNARVHQRSRYDHDRAFGVNLLVGWDILERLRWTLAGRYRDGEPMTRYFVKSLSQGPVSIMAHERGAPIPRHTFHMTLDTRLALGFEALSMRGVLSLDCLNLLGSGTELLEDIRTTSNWRKSLEMVPGRAILINLALKTQ